MSEPEILICPVCDAANRVPHARLADAPRCGKCKVPLFEGKPIALDARRFDRLIGIGTLPVLRIGSAYAYSAGSDEYANLRQAVARYTGPRQIRSFQGSYSGGAFSVGGR